MKVFLKFNEKLNVDVIVKSLKNSLENHNEVAVLATCFMIPDVFSKKMNGDKKEKYIKWFDMYVAENYRFADELGNDLIEIILNGHLFYQLRCAFLHAGNSAVQTDKISSEVLEISFVNDDDFQFPFEVESYGIIEHDGIITKKLKINIEKMGRIFLKSLNKYKKSFE